ncbi:hypothetical protein H920_07584 [Fukomys damarensis]|uniref:Uncharacterized protein n=1 Tax=Fukomys damarensis TaxID=885580 RepID=A0A091DFS5_FUKDA|nr:hypothetical protein H920_07584 [Fukomys damarensis]
MGKAGVESHQEQHTHRDKAVQQKDGTGPVVAHQPCSASVIQCLCRGKEDETMDSSGSRLPPALSFLRYPFHEQFRLL